jgi:DNA-binding NarL/FixJ family response regulator
MKTVVASRSPLLRAVLSEALTRAEEITLLDAVDTVNALTRSVHEHSPQVVLASPTLTDGALYPLVTDIVRSGARVLLVCDESDAEEASTLLFAGATGCMFVQDAGATDIVAAVHEVAAGHATLHPSVAATILTKWRASRSTAVPEPPAPPPTVEFTARERDVLEALARGLPTKSIGRELGVSPKTVEAHIGRLLAKLSARNRAQALSLAFERGLLGGVREGGPAQRRATAHTSRLEGDIASGADGADAGNHRPGEDVSPGAVLRDGQEGQLVQGTDVDQSGSLVLRIDGHCSVPSTPTCDHSNRKGSTQAASPEANNLRDSWSGGQQPPVGAYGLRVTGLDSVAGYLVEAPPSWPALTVERVTAPCDISRTQFADSWAEYRTRQCSGELRGVRLDRHPLAARMTGPDGLDDEATVHPDLTMVAALVARWLGRDALHGGGFLTPSGGWAVLGARESGKSSLLGHLSAKGVGIVADDLLVVQDGQVFAGARCIDLREGAAEWLGQGRALGRVGDRERWRVDVPACDPAAPVVGWILPQWGARVELQPVPAMRRLPLLYANLWLTGVPVNPEQLMRLAALPFFVFRRPRRWEDMEESAATLWDRVNDTDGTDPVGLDRPRLPGRPPGGLQQTEGAGIGGAVFSAPFLSQRLEIDQLGIDPATVPAGGERRRATRPERRGHDRLGTPGQDLRRQQVTDQ